MQRHYDFILIDGSSFLYRAFHALPPLHNSKGAPTGAIYGFIAMLKKLLNEFHPEFIAVVFDAKGKTFRDDLYEAYKAHRPKMPDDLQLQIEPLHQLIHAFGIPLLSVEGCEADDVIGTLVAQAIKRSCRCLIATSDKDMAQLVEGEQVVLLNTMTHVVLDEEGVKEKFGVPPTLIIDYLTLVGDSVDNVPGVPNVGPKTAAKWIQSYGDLDGIIKNAEKISGKVGENLRASIEQFPLSKQLLKIKQDVDLPCIFSDLKKSDENKSVLIKLFQELEFKSWLKELLEHSNETHTKSKNYQFITDEKSFNGVLKKIEATDLVAFDTETTSLDFLSAELVGISFSMDANEGFYIPIGHQKNIVAQQLDRNYVLMKLKSWFENPERKKIGHNLKYDLNILLNYQITIKGMTFDTLLESYVLQTSTRHDMDSLALKYLGHKTITFEDIAGKGKHQLTFDQIPLDIATEYAAEDADITLQLHEYLWPKIKENKNLRTVFESIEMPLMRVLAKMERRGVLIDPELLKQQSESLKSKINLLEEKIFYEAGLNFNLNSPKQLQEILYERMGIPVLEKTPTGQASTAESVLQELANNYEIAARILEYRSLSKLKSTYTDKLPLQIHPTTGRVHTSYNQAVVATGRLSSTDPNLQNIPIRTEEGRKIREAFIAPKGFQLVSADYSQIELRIMAHLSDDARLKEAFHDHEDIHSATASEIFGVPIEQVSGEQRRRAKAINFGLIYGMSSFGLAKQIDVSREDAQAYIDKYFQRYPGVKNYMDSIRAFAHEHQYVETIYGRRLYLPDINAQNMQRRKAAERAAINAPMQGSAADMIKLAMIATDKWLTQSDIHAHMLMQVHDELVFEVEEKKISEFVKMLESLMCENSVLKVPVTVEIGVGNNWRLAHE